MASASSLVRVTCASCAGNCDGESGCLLPARKGQLGAVQPLQGPLVQQKGRCDGLRRDAMRGARADVRPATCTRRRCLSAGVLVCRRADALRLLHPCPRAWVGRPGARPSPRVHLGLHLRVRARVLVCALVQCSSGGPAGSSCWAPKAGPCSGRCTKAAGQAPLGWNRQRIMACRSGPRPRARAAPCWPDGAGPGADGTPPTFQEDGLRESRCLTSRWDARACILAFLGCACSPAAAVLSAVRLLEPAG
jgi:hypothetical protein